MPRRQFSLRTFLIFFIAISALSAIIASAPRHPTHWSVITFVAVRALGIILIGSIAGFMMGGFRRAMIAAITSVAIADIVWFGFLRVVGAGADYEELLYNPLMLIAVVTPPAVCARTRRVALVVGISLSLALPIIGAAWALAMLPSGPGVRGTGLASVMIVMVACAAMIVGTLSTNVARFVIELIELASSGGSRSRSSSGETSDST